MNGKHSTLNEIAERTRLPVAWLKREADAGRIPSIRIGRRRMFRLEAVLRALTEREKQEAPNGR